MNGLHVWAGCGSHRYRAGYAQAALCLLRGVVSCRNRGSRRCGRLRTPSTNTTVLYRSGALLVDTDLGGGLDFIEKNS
jgi:hypothetical protein